MLAFVYFLHEEGTHTHTGGGVPQCRTRTDDR
jgi:hypothetical protein